MKRFPLLLASIVIGFVIYGQSGNPFLMLNYDSVVIYDFEYMSKIGEEFSIINKEGKLASVIYKSKTLNAKEVSQLSKMLGLKSSYGQGEAMCFAPHLGIVYYNKSKVAAHVTICMDCNVLESSIDIPNQQQGKQTDEDGRIYYLQDGMSDRFRKHLNALLSRYDFPHKMKT